MSGTRKHITVLLVEDNPDLRSATEDLLGTLGYETVVTATASQALEAARRQPLDLVIANAYPSRGSGLETVDRIRAAAPGLPALLVSGFGDDLELRRRVLGGDVGFLALPFGPETLETAITESLALEPAADGVSFAPPAARRRGPGSRFWLAAAVVTLAAGLALQLADRAPEMVAPEFDDVRRGDEIEPLAPVGELRELPASLAWRAAPGSDRYRVVLLAVDDTVIWTAETQETSVALPAAVVEQLDAAVSYYWQVQGYGEGSTPTGRSHMVAFRSSSRGPA